MRMARNAASETYLCFKQNLDDGHSPKNLDVSLNHTGTAVAQWLRCCATNRKVIGSIPDCVIGIFH